MRHITLFMDKKNFLDKIEDGKIKKGVREISP